MSPAQQLADGLIERRALGLPFDFAWTAAFDEINWPAERMERQEWRDALRWAIAEFRDSYERPHAAPRHVEDAVERCGGLLDWAVDESGRVDVLGVTVHA